MQSDHANGEGGFHAHGPDTFVTNYHAIRRKAVSIHEVN